MYANLIPKHPYISGYMIIVGYAIKASKTFVGYVIKVTKLKKTVWLIHAASAATDVGMLGN